METLQKKFTQIKDHRDILDTKLDACLCNQELFQKQIKSIQMDPFLHFGYNTTQEELKKILTKYVKKLKNEYKEEILILKKLACNSEELIELIKDNPSSDLNWIKNEVNFGYKNKRKIITLGDKIVKILWGKANEI